jgi:hypothetical protein
MLASRVRATGELVPARWLDVGLVAGLLVLVAVEAAAPPAAREPSPAVLLLALDQVLAPGLPEVARWLPRQLGSQVAAGRLDGDPGALAAGAVLAAYGLALTAGGWVAVRRAEAR